MAGSIEKCGKCLFRLEIRENPIYVDPWSSRIVCACHLRKNGARGRQQQIIFTEKPADLAGDMIISGKRVDQIGTTHGKPVAIKCKHAGAQSICIDFSLHMSGNCWQLGSAVGSPNDLLRSKKIEVVELWPGFFNMMTMGSQQQAGSLHRSGNLLIDVGSGPGVCTKSDTQPHG
ncbi:hypothetical protein AN403_5558 [Pseudomonas fluorescens]|uniref:Uncharacterized protein n=1 Tax=Pseudomonas fluorescens TaxID=294 RepID=A0A0P8X503_PSEFL|nr:hypothetical protein AN403_5558 [Pseudomonas fluorescens]